MVNWCLLDEYSLLQIFSYLSINDLAHVSKVCQSWYLVASDDSLWRSLFLRRFALKKATLPHFSKTWKSELRRILWTIPCPEIKLDPLKNPHSEEILHVCFSSDARYFATCGRDSIIALWDAQSCKIIDYEYLRPYGWQSAQQCEFNPEASMLMVSGVLMGDMMGRIKGEIMVFTLNKKLRICARISNQPWDTIGCWYGNKYVISSEFKWLAHMVSTSMLLLNKVSFALDKNANDHTLACVRVLYRFYNRAGNALRHLLISNLSKNLGNEDPDCHSGIQLLESLDPLVIQLLASENQSIVTLQVERNDEKLADSLDPYINNQYIKAMLEQKFEFDEDKEDKVPFEFHYNYFKSRRVAYEKGMEENDWIYDDDDFGENGDEEDDDDDTEWEYWDNSQELKNRKPEYVKIDDGHEVINEDEKLLICATGTVACIPHMIGIKRMSKVRFKKDMAKTSIAKIKADREAKEREEAQRKKNLKRDSTIRENRNHEPPPPPGPESITDWSDYKGVSHKFDHLDYLIEMHGRIVGMTLSPCHRYLYINVRPWPRDYHSLMTSPSHPPPVGSKLDRYALDLGRMAFVSQQIHQQNAFVPSDPCFWNPLSVTKHLIASSGNDHRAGIWDRHHGVQLLELAEHTDNTINAIALNPVDESMAVTVSDDMTLRVWKSKLAVRNNPTHPSAE